MTTFSAANDYFLVPNTLVNPVIKEKIEADRLDFHYELGLGHRFQVGAEMALEDLGGGWLDPIIRWYHDTVVNLHDIRDSFPSGTHVLLSPGGGPFSGGFGVSDLSLYGHYGFGSSSLASVGVKLPTGNAGELLGSGGIDCGAALQTEYQIAPRWRAVLQGGLVWQSRALALRGARPLVWQQNLAVVWAKNSRDSWIGQFTREPSALNLGVPEQDQNHATASFGYRRKLGERKSLTLFFSENVDLLNPNLPNGTNVGNVFVVGASLNVKL